MKLGFDPLTMDLWGKFHPFKAFWLARYIDRNQIDIVHTDYSRDHGHSQPRQGPPYGPLGQYRFPAAAPGGG